MNNRFWFKNLFDNKKAVISVFALILGVSFFALTAKASTSQELKEAINQKSAELQKLDAERQQILDNLSALNKESGTLQKDIKKNDYQISQLNLSIKSSEITIEKLGLEIESLDEEIKTIEAKSDTEKEAIINLLRELNEKEKQGILTLLLKNQSLADSISEAQGLMDLNSGLATEVAALRALHDERSQKLDQVSQKKEGQESAKTHLQNQKIIVQDQKKEKQTLLVANKTQEKVYQKRIDELEKMQLEIGAEIDKIESELRTKIDPNILPVARPGVLASPLNGVDLQANLTQAYGATPFAKKNYVGGFHNGIDIGTPVGTPVYAAENGRVLAVGNTDKYCPPVWYGRKKYGGSYGKYIVIKHDNNLSTMYSHLSLQVVKVGDIVNRGQLIGYNGLTGFTTGPHLHFTVYANIYGANEVLLSPEIKMSNTCGLQPYGATLNPLDYL
jgi:murein DD-endopeptidase MepM/ murein hydrolase activator NlpD